MNLEWIPLILMNLKWISSISNETKEIVDFEYCLNDLG
jgi:hypothetical protein